MNKNYFFVIAFLSFFSSIAQQAGDLDLSFGNNGIVRTNLWNASFNVKSHVVLPDGKTIVVGEINNDMEPRGFVMRLLANGDIDVTFGTDGKAVHPFINGINIVKLQTDGKILVGSSYLNDIAVARYMSNGTLDTGFAYDGTYYNTNSNNSNYSPNPVVDLEIQSDNKIVALTTIKISDVNYYKLFRLNSNGILDNTLNVTDNFGAIDYPVALSIQTDGKLLVSGYSFNEASTSLFIARYNSNGTDDTTFNSTGRRSFSITNATAARVTDLLIQPDGKILLGGKYYANGDALFMARFNTNGTFDTSFSGDGFQSATVDLSSNRPGKIALQSDGKIIQMDTYYNNTTSKESMLLARYTSTGELDNTFSGTSWGVSFPFNGLNETAACISIVDNKLIISGNAETSVIENNMAFAKFNLNPISFDTTFGNNGKKQLNVPFPTYEEVIKSVVQSDNKVVVLSKIFVNNFYYSGLQRFNENGSLDSTFGSNGKIGLGFYLTEFGGLAVDNANNILICGNTPFESSFILRITPAGALDPTFGDQGITYLPEDFLNFNPIIKSIKIQSDNKIILGGGNSVNQIADYLLIRLNANGTLDNTFGNNGISQIGLTNTYEMISSIEVLNDGKIIAIGLTEENYGNDYQAVILKFNTVGLLDPTFNGNGKFFTEKAVDFNTNGDIKVQNDGKILSTFESLYDNFILYRLNSNGTLDNNFGSSGYVSTYVTGDDKSAQIHYNPTNQKITLIGTTITDEIGKFALTRYSGNGETDFSFGDSGQVITNFGHFAQVISASPTSNGKLVVSGILYDDVAKDFDQIMAKYHLEESLSLNNPEVINVQIYPNPVTETLFVRLKDESVANNYNITDMTGKVVLHGSLVVEQGIKVTDLANGVYFIAIDNFKPIKFIKR
ncbi:T9SS type A sorting domain-containing protein [Flavobacterium azooxidireducens]|uniref:T9SS type A sorting domain-containing protein n=1 Tax=Flavobacterium azooxidireducens TaxID=1871076 RepID=A0ABY4KHV5_9FLAO|nr:T9SS type A sorting domain-containing protein [Flavobacterium azooxidireducens]UPQ79012.1 T9SS type A sorting domain-containing protein [Flavobacterium azooxidireducens]